MNMKRCAHPLLEGSPYRGYSYAYPHKTAYRVFAEPEPLQKVWRGEPLDSLFLYVHVPFCGMRCAFCNLFTQARPSEAIVDDYLDAVGRQAATVQEAIPGIRIARFALGGGTPTYLPLSGLARLWEICNPLLRVAEPIPTSVETSPDTADWERLAFLRDRGVTRVSIGVQSFVEAETSAVGRPQSTESASRALERIVSLGFPVLNIDLIYGLPGQTVESWLDSLHTASTFFPQELYLYPLYVRPLTGLGQSKRVWDDLRLECYREGRDFLLARNYQQISMRMFRANHCPDESGPTYCCQDDGMIGLGCGARSYTRAMHYSTRYGVRGRSVNEILEEYVRQSPDSFSWAHYGFRLNVSEQRRRFVIQSLLQRAGLSLAAYRQRFTSDAMSDLPELAELEGVGLAQIEDGFMVLTEAGLERSDVIGPSLHSPSVRALMETFEWR
jgi:oxygen-independent coproporphyrinogen-3 oxidase